MKNRFRMICTVAWCLAITLIFTACGGPAGKISETRVETIYYDDTAVDSAVEGEESSTLPNNQQPLDHKSSLPNLDHKNSLPNLDLDYINSLPNKVPGVKEDGSFTYTIIRSAAASVDISDTARELRTAIRKNLNTDLDSVLETASKDHSGYEILIGETNRKESANAISRIRKNRTECLDDFIVKVDGKKIVITGENDKATKTAVQWFSDTFCKSITTWGYLREGYEFFYTPEITSPEITIAGQTLTRFKAVMPRLASYVYGRAICDLQEFIAEEYNTDFVIDDERVKEVDYEILVSDLDRPESKSVTAEKNGWVIKAVGKKLVIKGYSDVETYYAAVYFLDSVKNAVKTGKGFQITDGYEKRGTVDYSKKDTIQYSWGDEFDGTEIDATKWGNYIYTPGAVTGSSALGGSCWDGKFTDTVKLKDGIATLNSRRIGKDFENCHLATNSTFWYRYGVCEIKVKMADTPADFSFWLNFTGGKYGVNTEIDVVENFGQTNTFASNIHKWWSMNSWDGMGTTVHTSLDGSHTTQKRFTFANDDRLNTDYHIVSFDWTDSYFDFAVDGKRFFKYDYTYDTNRDTHKTLHCIIFSACVGRSNYGIKFDEKKYTATSWQTSLDYIRLYQKPVDSANNVYSDFD